MKKEDIKKPNPNALPEAAKLINDLVKKSPSDDFFESVEKTDISEEKIPKVASQISNDLFENQY